MKVLALEIRQWENTCGLDAGVGCARIRSPRPLPQRRLERRHYLILRPTSPTNGALFFASATFTIQDTASDSDGKVVSVEFYRATTPLGAAVTSPYRNNVVGLPQGVYALKALATDDQGAKTTARTDFSCSLLLHRFLFCHKAWRPFL